MAMKLPIYMDYQATTPIDPRVLETMAPYYRDEFGNAASRSHSFGWHAAGAVENARLHISRLIHASEPEEVIFTSGATESSNLAIKGIADMYHEKGNHIITTVIEHRSVLDTCQFLERIGFQVTYLPVDAQGLIRLDSLKEAITDKTILISVMYANNEIGTLQPVAEIGTLAKKCGIFFHCDMAQAIGKVPVDVEAMGVDLASFSAHKIYGPKGIGALYVRTKNPRVRLSPLIHGGGHERGFRSGTLNVPGIVGFGKASELAQTEMPEEAKRLLSLRERLRKGITNQLTDVSANGSLEKRLPGNLNLSFAFVEGETLLTEICKDVAVSSGSACTSATLEPSYVLKAIGVSEELAHTSVRFGLGRFNAEEEVDYVIQRVVKVVKELRSESPIFTIHEKERRSGTI